MKEKHLVFRIIVFDFHLGNAQYEQKKAVHISFAWHIGKYLLVMASANKLTGYTSN